MQIQRQSETFAYRLSQRSLTDEERSRYKSRGWRGGPCEDPEHHGIISGRCAECGSIAMPSLVTAALNEDTIGKLHSEFRDWWRSGDGLEAFHGHPLIDRYHTLKKIADKYDQEGWPQGDEGNEITTQFLNSQGTYRRIQNEMKRRGPIGWWPNVENFLKQKYPAAHKNFEAGLEDAAHWLDKGGVYDTGQDSISQYGYDPREVAAGMVFLHNESHPFRGDMAQKDQQRLTDIYNKRVQMQEEYNQKQLVSASYYGY